MERSDAGAVALRGSAFTIGTAVGVYVIAYDGGSFDIVARSTIGVVALWVLAAGILLGGWSGDFWGKAAVTIATALVCLAALTLASSRWSGDSESALIEFDRLVTYLAVFTLAVFAGTPRRRSQMATGIAIGIAAVGASSLVYRLIPGALPGAGLEGYGNEIRLSYPVNYWNGLAILLALGIPLLLQLAASTNRVVWRGLALAPIPALAAAIYLASSRGGVICAVLGIVVLVLASGKAWDIALALLLAAAGSLAAVFALVQRPEVVNGPLGTVRAASSGHHAAIMILGACALTGASYLSVISILRRALRPSRTVKVVVGVVVGVVTVVGVATAHPVDHLRAFTKPPEKFPASTYVQSHLLNANSTGRWQVWSSAVDQFTENPWVGDGSGSFQHWWLEHGTLSDFVVDAHSLYLQTLGELGIVGFVLIAIGFLTAIVAGVARIGRESGDEQLVDASLLAVLVAFAFAAGIDWVWQLPAVAVIGVASMGLVAARNRRVQEASLRPKSLWLVRGALALGLVAAIVLQAIPLATAIHIRDSKQAFANGDLRAALTSALAAREAQPWAASPYLQLALVREASGDTEGAHGAVRQAIVRSRSDWRSWLIAARIETRLGLYGEARDSLHRAERLNPHSPIFTSAPR